MEDRGTRRMVDIACKELQKFDPKASNGRTLDEPRELLHPHFEDDITTPNDVELGMKVSSEAVVT